jgi:hypothetical protein
MTQGISTKGKCLSLDIDEDILQTLALHSIDEKKARNLIENNKHNQITTT